ncbi:hypothetical protein AVEN_229176-1 [Araneus ventricosus]|uniref:Uncharacterized protein n=1 Tax=Araneus ventricosus TaxID=182803 RepID=A0A4Y2JNR6_ARAVE|nr:hypothetical protein AVEN_229176-1 [Araneus ventricosus]
MTRMTPELAPPFQISTPHQLEEDGPTTCDLKCHRPTYAVALIKKDYEVLSLSELNELENWATELGGTVDSLDLYTSDDVVSRKFQQHEYRESEQVSLHLIENEAYISVTST